MSGVVGWPSRSVGNGWQTLPQCREWSAVSPKVLGMVGRPSRSVGSGQQALLECQEWSVALP